jgi:DNA-binding MarR family transcriptional regulator
MSGNRPILTEEDVEVVAPESEYVLEEQVGFILRQATQRHTALFAGAMSDELTPTQFAALVKLKAEGPCSQNRLGRLTAMDAATIKGVIDRLTKRGFTQAEADPGDGRRLVVALTPEGAVVADRAINAGRHITEATLAPLSALEQRRFLDLLKKLR